jgi:Rps23 Pro-64 3,4-dihydroxylase Tpa1-like proline 4-hydroxylase
MSAIAPMRAFEVPAPHSVIPNFMGDDMVERLLAHADANREAFVPTKVGRNPGKLNPDVRISRGLRDFGTLKEELKARFESVREQAVATLQLSRFALTSMELELVAHGDGAFYGRHIDTGVDFHESAHDSGTDRLLTGVYYFHTLPKGFTGGEIRLHSILPPEQGGSVIDVEPERDRLLLFPSWAPHEVRPVRCPSGSFIQSRFAINCWYRSPRSP